jgi:hypothetical protein
MIKLKSIVNERENSQNNFFLKKRKDIKQYLVRESMMIFPCLLTFLLISKILFLIAIMVKNLILISHIDWSL